MKEKYIKTSLGKGGKGQTDWQQVDALTDADIARAMQDDADTFEPVYGWFSTHSL